ncbi:hypothetical protein AGMMS49928_25770 [Spirochaetia bacterium]|nr:hypothetical protein AGMMS49928_25770 [Spirochaetia bacterium]
MKNVFLFCSFYILFFVSGSLYAVGEKTFVIGSSSGWNLIEKRTGVDEVSVLRPHPVLALKAASGPSSGTADPTLDLALSFDEGKPHLFADKTGHYRVFAGPALSAADSRWARAGSGAALFNGDGGKTGGNSLALVPLAGATGTGATGAQLAAGRYVRDFSLEFWLYPMNLENGEQILAWSSSKPLPSGDFVFQRIYCVAAKNRLQWSFDDFFSSPDGKQSLTISLNGFSPLAPKSWSHHLLRFDAGTGLLEYLVNGKAEAITHTTSSGREGGEVYTPIMGEDGRMTLGDRFMGLLDELKMYSRYVNSPELSKYPASGGRVESRFIDLGKGNSSLLKVYASGGRASISGKTIQNEYSGAGDFRFRDNAALQFFIRAGDSPYQWTEEDWRPFTPGAALPPEIKGRFIQLAADFYPSGNGESTPYLDELRIVYRNNGPPIPPSLLTAAARDGAVELSWRASPGQDVTGYLVYYGTVQGEYFGDHAVLGISPLDAGNRSSLRIEGLRNGTLYYFAVAAYDHSGEPGEFSREASARPLKTAK